MADSYRGNEKGTGKQMSVIVNPIVAGICKNCGESTRYFYVALKNGQYSHTFNCTEGQQHD